VEVYFHASLTLALDASILSASHLETFTSELYCTGSQMGLRDNIDMYKKKKIPAPVENRTLILTYS
jgi:hypothetical protein